MTTAIRLPVARIQSALYTLAKNGARVVHLYVKPNGDWAITRGEDSDAAAVAMARAVCDLTDVRTPRAADFVARVLVNQAVDFAAACPYEGPCVDLAYVHVPSVV